MNVSKNIGFGLRVRKQPKDVIEVKVRELLELVKLEDKANSYPAQLSGGERQRMALARALAIEPRVLLLDEPFGALDAIVRTELRHFVKELHRQIKVTTILVTHDQDEAMEVADQLLIMHAGKIEQAGEPTELYERPATEFVHSFLGPTTLFKGVAVRPHDLELVSPSVGSIEGVVTSIMELGFEIQVTITLSDGSTPWVQMSRNEFRALGVTTGSPVSVRERVAQ
jgi:sulfate transport system ATP-binding protein